MSIGYCIAVMIISMIAGSYGWGMRGSIIGGEKGAMVPGALFGLCFSSLVNFKFWPYFAAMGAFAMFQGGSCTYGETLRFILNNDFEGEFKGKMKHGLKGIFINGGNWFGVTCFYISLLYGYYTEIYSSVELAAAVLCVPVIQTIGEFIFNKPYDKEKGKFPKLYYSLTRREEWGGNLLLCVAGFIFAIVKKDVFTACAVIAGYISGGTGFCLGAYIFYYNRVPHDGKFVFGKYEENKKISNWKIMEHTFGTVGFAGSMMFFIQRFRMSGFILPHDREIIIEDKYSIPCIYLCLALALLFSGACLLYEKKGHKPNDHICDIIMRPLFASFPVIIALLSTEKCAKAYTVVFCMYVLTERMIEKGFKKFKEKNILFAILGVLFILASIIAITDKITLPVTVIVLAPVYVIVDLYEHFGYYKLKEMKQAGKTFFEYFGDSALVQSHFVILTIILTITAFLVK